MLFTLGDLANHIDATVDGDSHIHIDGLATLQSAGPSQLAFFANQRYQAYLSSTQAAAVLLRPGVTSLFQGNKLLAVDPYLAYAQLTELFAVKSEQQGVHSTAVIADDVVVPTSVYIGPNAVVEPGVKLAENVIIGAGCYLGRDVSLGAGTQLSANVSVYGGVTIGAKCIVHSGCVIGADGFGFAPSQQGWQKIYQLGRVVIGDCVEIGAGTTIDRGALDDTVISSGVKIDNQVQIAHNVQIGEDTAIAGAVAIAGSTIIGKRCTIAGAVGIVGHLTISDDVHITAMSLVTKSIVQPGSYSSGVPLNETRQWRKNAARFNQLDAFFRRQKAHKHQ